MCRGLEWYKTGIQYQGENGRSCGRGSLTSSAEKIFFADIQVEVIDTGSAILDMYLLLISISIILKITFALVRCFIMKSRFIQAHLKCNI